MRKLLLRCCCLALLAGLFTCAGEVDEMTADETIGLETEAYHLAIEVVTNGAQGVVVATGKQADGRDGYLRLALEKARNKSENFPADGRVTPAETDSILHHVGRLIAQLESTGEPITNRYLVLSPEYEKIPGVGEALRRRLSAAFPDFRVDRLSPELEARANYFTMAGRIDMDFRDFVLADIGAASTSISVFDYPGQTLPRVSSLPYGSRTTITAVDPLLDLRVRRRTQRRRIQDLVNELTEIEIRKIMRGPGFAEREKVVFMGGLVYKIVRILDIPLNGKAIDFSPKSDADLPARFKAMLQDPNADLSPGPDYSPEAIYAALMLLETLMDEAGERQSVYFFERATWLPGHVLGMELLGAESPPAMAE